MTSRYLPKRMPAILSIALFAILLGFLPGAQFSNADEPGGSVIPPNNSPTDSTGDTTGGQSRLPVEDEIEFTEPHVSLGQLIINSLILL